MQIKKEHVLLFYYVASIYSCCPSNREQKEVMQSSRNHILCHWNLSWLPLSHLKHYSIINLCNLRKLQARKRGAKNNNWPVLKVLVATVSPWHRISVTFPVGLSQEKSVENSANKVTSSSGKCQPPSYVRTQHPLIFLRLHPDAPSSFPVFTHGLHPAFLIPPVASSHSLPSTPTDFHLMMPTCLGLMMATQTAIIAVIVVALWCSHVTVHCMTTIT